jgi:hypothetical protein
MLSKILSSLGWTFNTILTSNLYHVDDNDFEYSDIGFYGKESHLTSRVITINQVSDAIDFNIGMSNVKSAIITTNQNPEELQMSTYQNVVNTVSHQSKGEQKMSDCECQYYTRE